MTLLTPPAAEKKPKTITIHNHSRVDEYYWLRERDNPDVIAHLTAENEYTQAKMAHTEALQQTLYEEMVGRIQETDSSAEVKMGEYLYYHRTTKGEQYPTYCRKKGKDGTEEILLDLNGLAKGDYLRLGMYKISPDQTMLAYSLDEEGSEKYTIYVKLLKTGELLPDQIPNTTYSLEWAEDNKTLFYTTQDEAKRAYKLFRHQLGAESSRDVELFHEPDELFSVYLYKTKDKTTLVLYVGSIESSECWVLPASSPLASLQRIHPRQLGVRYDVEHRDGSYYFRTNADESPNFKVMTADVENAGIEHWQEFIPHRPQVKIDDFAIFADHYVLYERENGLQQLQVGKFADGESYYVTFPEMAYSIAGSSNPEFNVHTLRFAYMSLATPKSEYDYDMESRERTLAKREPVLGGFDPENYQSERIFAAASDGTQVPISLVYRKGLEKNGANPTLLYGYGSYGINLDPWFDGKRLSLVDRGFVFAIAHVRGGQEMGRYWYDQGKFLQKKNSFTDFIACAERLIAGNYTNPDQLAIEGRSAGGLLMGATLNLAPHLFKSAIAGVPFVDVVTTMLDETIPLTVGEFEEWGNPKDKEYYDYMLSYSPYDNIEAKAYPHILATAGLNDPRVQYWEPAKWVAKLRPMKTDDNLILLKTNMGAGHGGASGRYDYLRERAFEYAFLLTTVAGDDAPPNECVS